MILLHRGASAEVVVTATEKAVLSPTEFSLVFTNDITKAVVNYEDVPDESPAPDRYNLFSLDLSLFDGHDNEFWTYEVKDQAGNILETGKMKLEGVITPPVQYQDTPKEYVTYGD